MEHTRFPPGPAQPASCFCGRRATQAEPETSPGMGKCGCARAIAGSARTCTPANIVTNRDRPRTGGLRVWAIARQVTVTTDGSPQTNVQAKVGRQRKTTQHATSGQCLGTVAVGNPRIHYRRIRRSDHGSRLEAASATHQWSCGPTAHQSMIKPWRSTTAPPARARKSPKHALARSHHSLA